MKASRYLTIFVTVFFVATQVVVAQPQQSGSPQVQATGGLVLEDGTAVKLRISRTVSSADAQVGDTVDFEVLEEIRLGEVLVVPKGGVAWATVTVAESKKRMARGGKLGMNIDSVRVVDGQKVALRAVKQVKGGGHTGAMTGAIVATAIVFWPAAPFFLFMHGKDISIPKGTEITAYVNGDFKFDAERFKRRTALQAGTARTPQTGLISTTPSSGEATIEISSDPLGADIELDGNFVGSTPSSVGVDAGEHTLRVSKNGYGRWERQLRTSTGSIKVMAALNATPVQAVPEHDVPMSTALPPDSARTAENQSVALGNHTTASEQGDGATGDRGASTNPVPVSRAFSVSSPPGVAEESALGVWFAGNPSVRHDCVEVAGVQHGGPADSIDMKKGDWILALDGHFLYTIDELRAELLRHEPGTRLSIRYLRNKLIYDNYVVLLTL